MPATVSTDFVFEPKVWSDHVQAYFDTKLVYGAFALRNEELKAEGTGVTINFPYFKAIGAAEEPSETASLAVDNLSDDSFNTTVFEVGKAVGIKAKAFKVSAARTSEIVSEAQRQIGRVLAEKVDDKLNTEITTAANYVAGYTATAAANVMTNKILLQAKVVAFGDKHEEAEVCFMHSRQWLDMMKDSTAGFLKADANDPFSAVKGFMGRMFGMAIVVVDTVKLNVAGQIDSTDNYLCTFHKANSFGIMTKQEIEMEQDRDILARENLYSATQWYAVKSFHAKIAALDYKAGSCITTIS